MEGKKGEWQRAKGGGTSEGGRGWKFLVGGRRGKGGDFSTEDET